MTDRDVERAIDCLTTAWRDIGEAMRALDADSGSRLGEAQAIVHSVMSDLEADSQEASYTAERMQEYRSNG